jgi:hypothetical protein
LAVWGGGGRNTCIKNTLNALRLCKLDAVIGQGKMALVREKSWKSQGILISLLCGNPVKLLNKCLSLLLIHIN